MIESVAAEVLRSLSPASGSLAVNDGMAVATNDTTMDAAGLQARAGGVAEALASLPGSGPVVVLAGDAIALAAATLGALAVGRAVLPLDRRAGRDQLTDRLRTTDAAAVLVHDEPTAALLPATVPHMVLSDLNLGTLTPQPVPADAPALLGTTSGSTGRPRLVVQTHGQLRAHLLRPGRRAILPEDRFGMLLGATAGSVRRLLEALVRGAPIACLDARDHHPDEVLRQLIAARVTYLWLVPTYLRRLLAAASARPQLPQLRVLALPSEPVTWQDVAAIRARLAPSVTIRHAYGASEVGNIAESWLDAHEPIGQGLVPVGRPSSHVQVRIRDLDGTWLAAGRAGEVVVESHTIRHGAPAEQLADGRRRYSTGDLGRLREDGSLELLGRLDRMVKVGGYRVQPTRIEALLAELDWVEEVAVLPHRPSGTAAQGLIAHLHGVPGSGTDLAAVTSLVTDHLEGRVHPAEIPDRVVLHDRPLPTLDSGKVDTWRLGTVDR